jgi:acyl-CoA reductase-like NAD-dependent aldehyde dehydrogenase
MIFRDDELIRINTINPYTENMIQSYEVMSKSEVKNIVQTCRDAFSIERSSEIKQRISNLSNLIKLLKHKRSYYASIITREMGKPITQSLAEIDKCILICEYYEKNGEIYLIDQKIETNYHQSYLSYEPIGIVGCIMPWNFPFLELFKFAIPALIAGNAIILKHSRITVQCSLELELLFSESGFRKGIFKTIIGDHELGEYLIKQKIDAVSITSSVKTGRRIATLAARYLKKTVLELGGSDPFIVLEDADLKSAAENAVKSRLLNTGQSCIAAKRFLVMENVFDEFLELFLKYTEAQIIGDPMHTATTIGPIVRNKQRNQILYQIEDGLSKGANLILGGKALKSKGYFMEPTILTNLNDRMLILKEEVFGPVSPIQKIRTEAESIFKANRSSFGLGATIWTQNLNKGMEMSQKLECGMVYVNEMMKSDPRMPFGGVKNSGIGRELSNIGIKEFVNIKSFIINKL